MELNFILIFPKVTMAKTMPTNKTLPLCDLRVSLDGVFIEATGSNTTKKWNYTIDTISYGHQKNKFHSTSNQLVYTLCVYLLFFFFPQKIRYGVQDLVYTRVFAMIVVKDNFNIKDPNPFEVHAFVCDSR